MGDNCGNRTSAMKGLTKFDSRKSGDFRDWHKIHPVVLRVTPRDSASLIKGNIGSADITVCTVCTDTILMPVSTAQAGFDMEMKTTKQTCICLQSSRQRYS